MTLCMYVKCIDLSILSSMTCHNFTNESNVIQLLNKE